ncbi:MAG: hypothetical protein AAFU61_16210, partial [Pseudomonadota bacterium]
MAQPAGLLSPAPIAPLGVQLSVCARTWRIETVRGALPDRPSPVNPRPGQLLDQAVGGEVAHALRNMAQRAAPGEGWTLIGPGKLPPPLAHVGCALRLDADRLRLELEPEASVGRVDAGELSDAAARIDAAGAGGGGAGAALDQAARL